MPCVYICSPCCTVCWTRSCWRMRCPPHYHWIDSVLTLIKFQVLTWACSLWSTRCSTPSDCMLSLIMFQVLTRTCSLWSTPYDCSVCMLTLVMFQVWTWPRSRWGTRCSPHYYCMPTLHVSGLNLTPKWLGDEVLTSLWLHANTRCVSGFDLNPVAGGTRCSLHYDCSDCMLTIVRFVTSTRNNCRTMSSPHYDCRDCMWTLVKLWVLFWPTLQIICFSSGWYYTMSN